jgi:hypothetical protein
MATDIAFALAGLGGFNAHGAGFLAAAQHYEIVPDLVTATSGQILVLADWLRGRDLRASLIDPEREANKFSQLQIALTGYPGIFRPAYVEAWSRLWNPPSPTEDYLAQLTDRLLPAQQYVPTRTDEFFAEMADAFNNAARIGGKDVGVLFNAYDLKSGKAMLFGNDAARALLPKKSALQRTTVFHDARFAKSGDGSDEAAIRPITGDAVRAALWLTLYGFEQLPGGMLDGAYHRSCLVSELHEFDRIFVARPLANGWLGRRPPSNWFEVQDWNTEMWFSVGYKAEVEALSRINDLIEAGLLDKKFKKVELVEIAPETPAGYFNFFIERGEVYERAFKKASVEFERLLAGNGAGEGGAGGRSDTSASAGEPEVLAVGRSPESSLENTSGEQAGV